MPECIKTVERAARNGDADNGENRGSGKNTGEMRRSAGGGENDFEAALFGRGSVFVRRFRRAMRGNDADFMCDSKLVQGVMRL